MSKARPITPGEPAENENATEAIVPEPLTAQQIDDLKTRAAKADENWERLLRTTADFENFKKAGRARASAKTPKFKYGQRISHQKSSHRSRQLHRDGAGCRPEPGWRPAIAAGVGVSAMIHVANNSAALPLHGDRSGGNRMPRAKPLTRTGTRRFPSRNRTQVPEGQVLQQLRKGYKLRDRLIRPATVIVAKKPAA